MDATRHHIQAQQIARQAMERIQDCIQPGMELAQVRRLCEAELCRLGAESFWYYDIGAFCFAGDQTALSVSGRQYQVADRRLQGDEILTIDLSPQVNGCWGDYARTIILQQGKAVRQAEQVQNGEWRRTSPGPGAQGNMTGCTWRSRAAARGRLSPSRRRSNSSKRLTRR